MIRRLSSTMSVVGVLLGAVALAVLALSAPASAAPTPYPPSNPPSLSASAYDPCAGDSNVIGGNGFQPGETVTLTLSGQGRLATVVAGADGSFEITIVIPLDARGSGELIALGQTSGLTASLSLSFPCVAGQSGTSTPINGGGSLAFTGVVITGAVLLGVLLLAGGALLVIVGRRRRVGTPA